MSSDKTFMWGNGIEAEFALFRNPLATLNPRKIKFLFFDSQGPIRPKRNKEELRYVYAIYKKRRGVFSKRVEKAIEFSKDVEKEIAGKVCYEKMIIGKDSKYVYYLLETKTNIEDAISWSNYGKKYLELFVKDLQSNIKKVLKNYTDFRPDYKKDENRKFGTPVLFPYGMSSKILLRNLNTNEYKNGPVLENYTGSYHFTFTLPFQGTPRCTTQANNHKFFANLIQWIEPLIGSAYHSCDDRSVGNGNKYTKGSYRVAMTGWGNFGGSDLKRIKCVKPSKNKTNKNYEMETLYKYSYRDPKWRDNLPFKKIKLLDPCRKNITGEQGDSLGGDFRTPFFVINDMDYNKNGEEKVVKTYYYSGLEIRIFDWFSPKHLKSLARILVMLAERSRTTRVKMFVYGDEFWNEAVRRFMIKGWLAILPIGYVKQLEKVFDLKLNPKSYRAHDIFKELVQKLFEVTKSGKWTKLMSEKSYKTPPKLPRVNQKSWDFAFVQYLLENPKNKIISFTNSLSVNSLKEIKLRYKKYFPGKNWTSNFSDILEFLQDNKIVKLFYDSKGNIVSLKKVSNRKLNLLKIFIKLLKG
jgi:hypothetical protein